MTNIFIYDFAVVLLFAFLIINFFSKRAQPAVFGYLVAGVLIGPYALGLVSDIGVINVFADLGIILLMYSAGLEFSIKKLRKVGGPATAIGVLEIFLFLAIGHTLGTIFGLSYLESIFLGGILAFSSTAGIIKVLMDTGALRKEYSSLILGILIIEDVGAIVLLTILGSLSMVGMDLLWDAAGIILRIGIFFSITFVIGLKYIPPFIDRVRSSGGSEALLLASLGLCFALSALSDYLGFSVALGAFMMGAIISEARFKNKVKKLTGPIRDIFASMFFISIGMLVDPFVLKDYILEITAVSLIAIVGKIMIIGLGLYLAGYSGLTSLNTGLGLVPRGEFSFIIAKLGVDSGAVGQEFYLITVAMAMVTTFVGPSLLGSSVKIRDLIYQQTPEKVKGFFIFLGNWIRSLGGMFKTDTDAGGELRRIIKEMAINVLIIVIIYQGVLIGRYYALGTLSNMVGVVLGYIGLTIVVPSWFQPGIAAMAVGIVLSLPSFYIIIRDIRMLIDLSIAMASAKFKFMGAEVVEKTLRNATYIFTIFIFTITLLPIIISEAFGRGFPLTGSILALIAVSGVLFWRTLGGFQKNLHQMITDTLLAEEQLTSEDMDFIVDSIATDKDFGIEKFKVKAGSKAAGKRIGETEIRARTGVTIIAVERGSRTIRNPYPSQVLVEGDKILLIGTEDEREKARKYLTDVQSHLPQEGVGLAKLKVPGGSQVVGQTLNASKLRTHTGVTIIGIERGSKVIRNPSAMTVIEGSDILLLLGTEAEVKNARIHLMAD